MTIQDLIKFYTKKEKHYPISDCFIKAGYGQKKNGYIKKAKKENKRISCEDAEPDQRWHFLESYASTLDGKGDAKSMYRIICPELLLWMAEAAGIDSKVVTEAEQRARAIIDNGTNGYARNKAGWEIKTNIIKWEMIEKQISDKLIL